MRFGAGRLSRSTDSLADMGGMEGDPMTVDEYRAMADRSRELHRVAERDDIREQLRQ